MKQVRMQKDFRTILMGRKRALQLHQTMWVMSILYSGEIVNEELTIIMQNSQEHMKQVRMLIKM